MLRVENGLLEGFLSVPSIWNSRACPAHLHHGEGLSQDHSPQCDGPSSLLLGTDCSGMGVAGWAPVAVMQVPHGPTDLMSCTLGCKDLVTLFPQRQKTTKGLGLDVL